MKAAAPWVAAFHDLTYFGFAQGSIDIPSVVLDLDRDSVYVDVQNTSGTTLFQKKL